jgi:hypothetical protein
LRFLTVIAIAFLQVTCTGLLLAIMVDDPSPPAWQTVTLAVLQAPSRLLALLPLVDRPQSGVGLVLEFLLNGAAWGTIIAAAEHLYRHR